MFALVTHILKVNKNNTKISMAPEQGWYANLWSVPYFKKERKSHLATCSDSIFINFSEWQKSEIKDSCLDVSAKGVIEQGSFEAQLEGFLWQWEFCSVVLDTWLCLCQRRGTRAFTYIHGHAYVHAFREPLVSHVLLLGTLEKVMGAILYFFTSPFLMIL